MLNPYNASTPGNFSTLCLNGQECSQTFGYRTLIFERQNNRGMYLSFVSIGLQLLEVCFTSKILHFIRHFMDGILVRFNNSFLIRMY